MDPQGQMPFREPPARYLAAAAALFDLHGGRTIVEIGGLVYPPGHRRHELWGGSVLVWARKTRAQTVFSVDINPWVFAQTQQWTADLENVRVVNRDGIEFLEAFAEPIDLLYLDAWDVSAGPGGHEYQHMHLRAFEAALPNLSRSSLIVIDDTDIDDGGKGRLILPEARCRGFTIWWRGRQTLLSMAEPTSEAEIALVNLFPAPPS